MKNFGTLILLCGLPGAGKTTLAKKLEVERSALRLCPDEWIKGIIEDTSDLKELSRLRSPVETLLWELGKKALKLGADVILENGFWPQEERNFYRDYAHQHGYKVELHTLIVAKKELWRRVENRNIHLTEGDFEMSEEEFNHDWDVFEPPTEEELATYDNN